MHRDGVDIGDQGLVDAWIAQQNASGFAGSPGMFDGGPGVFPGPVVDPSTWDDIDLQEAFGIPDIVAPIRLPVRHLDLEGHGIALVTELFLG